DHPHRARPLRGHGQDRQGLGFHAVGRAAGPALRLQHPVRERARHQPRGADRRGPRQLLHHGAELRPGGCRSERRHAGKRGAGEAGAGWRGLHRHPLRPEAHRQRPRHRRGSPARTGGRGQAQLPNLQAAQGRDELGGGGSRGDRRL
ncbi:MAG: Peroxiredoxin OsmC, partial [uncultured Sphingomonas sp.]